MLRCEWRGIGWETLDEPLYRAASRSRRTQKLEVDIRVVSVMPEADGGVRLARIVDSLTRFKEKGHIRVIRVGLGWCENVVYPSPPSPVE